jgi:hypothetical protein
MKNHIKSTVNSVDWTIEKCALCRFILPSPLPCIDVRQKDQQSSDVLPDPVYAQAQNESLYELLVLIWKCLMLILRASAVSQNATKPRAVWGNVKIAELVRLDPLRPPSLRDFLSRRCIRLNDALCTFPPSLTQPWLQPP